MYGMSVKRNSIPGKTANKKLKATDVARWSRSNVMMLFQRISKNLKNNELLITTGLGHRKILGDEKVIEKIVQFATN